MEVQLVAVVAVTAAERRQHRHGQAGHAPHRARQRRAGGSGPAGRRRHSVGVAWRRSGTPLGDPLAGIGCAARWHSEGVQRFNGLDAVPAGFGPSVVTIGNFDGVHRGHQAVLAAVVGAARRRGLPAVAVTFDPHPVAVLSPRARAPPRSRPPRTGSDLLEAAGLDAVLLIAFTLEFAQWSPERFVREVFVDALHARAVVVGPDTRFGHRNSGDLGTLCELGDELGFEVEVGRGDRTGAGGPRRRPAVVVVMGARAARRGRRPRRLRASSGGRTASSASSCTATTAGASWAIPTANLAQDAVGQIPADGVYAGRLVRPVLPPGAPDAVLPAAISVGTNPTFDGTQRRVEAYVLDRDDLDLYGERVAFEFVERLRPTLRFDGVQPLVEQMAADVAQSRQVLGAPEPTPAVCADHATGPIRASHDRTGLHDQREGAIRCTGRAADILADAVERPRIERAQVNMPWSTAQRAPKESHRMPLTLHVKKQIMTEYATNEGDTGSPEVQIAMLTQRIKDLTEHSRSTSTTTTAVAGLLLLVGQRRRLLRYLEAHRHRALPLADQAPRPAPISDCHGADQAVPPFPSRERRPSACRVRHLQERRAGPQRRSSAVASGTTARPVGLDRRPKHRAQRRCPSGSMTQKKGGPTWRVQRSLSPKPSSTTARSAPARSGSRPAGSPSRPAAPSPPTSTTTRCCCPPPPPASSPKDQFDFFPLTVDVEERMYAAGKIPGSFFRREGRPSTDAILTCRLIDRPLRPTFTKGLRNEVQVVITVLALNPDHQYDVLAINAASASTQISGLPFSRPDRRRPRRAHRRPVGRLPELLRHSSARSSTWSSPAASCGRRSTTSRS